MYSDDDVAALYDRLNPWVPSDDFYLSCVLEVLRADRGRLRFLDAEEVGAALGRAGFEVEAWYGDWSRGPLTEGSDNIVVVAGATSAPHGR